MKAGSIVYELLAPWLADRLEDKETLMRTSILTKTLALTVIAGALSSTSNAVNVITGPGDNILPGTSSGSLGALTGGTLLASLTSAFSTASWAGTLHTSVIKETSGTLSFLYQIQVTSGTDFLTRMTTVDFTGFTTDVDYFSDGFTGFGYAVPVGTDPFPHTADRHTSNVIGFDFSNGANDPGLVAGQTTNVMYIRTDATNYTKGSTSMIDGFVATVDSFQPTAAVPGPAALIPFGIGFAASLARRRQKR